eukprot:10046181-Alexandrium_andersonii.AAC.1
MSGSLPEDPPGLERGPKRSRSLGAAPSTRTSPASPTTTSTPTAFGPPQQPPAEPERVRASGR